MPKKEETNSRTPEIYKEIPSFNENNKVIYLFDQNTGRYQYMSSDINNLAGYSIEEFNSKGFKSIVKKVISGKKNTFRTEYNENSEAVEEFSATYLIERKDGQHRWIEDNAFTKLDKKGKRIYSIGVLRDISEFKEKLDKLIDDKTRLEAILKLSDVIFLMLDKNRNVILLNEKGFEVFGVKDIIGKNYENLLRGNIKDESILLFKKFLDPASEQDIKCEIKCVDHSGECILGWQRTILKDEDGQLISIIASGRDITEKKKEILEAISHPVSMAIERKRVEQEREKLIDNLSELNTSKDKLFSLISHDLRSPFNSLLGFSEILTGEYDSLTDDEIREYLNVIYEASQNLYGMTNNLLQYSRFQMGRIEFRAEKLDVEKIINNSIKLLKGNIVKKEINIFKDVEPGIYINADEDMLNSIIQNLLSNAIKFTDKGGDVSVSAKKIVNSDGKDEIEFTIEDKGTGISEVNMQKILKGEMFSTPGTEREYGTGLGVVLVKDFIEKNNGRLKIESEQYKGSRFICCFPLA